MAALCSAAVIGVPLAAGASAPHRTLSGSEYSELSAMYSGLLNTANAGNWAVLRQACEKAGTATPLLATQRSSCVDEVNTISYIETLSSAEKTCNTAIAASSGSGSTAAQDLSVLQEISCLNNDYQQLSKLAGDSYTQEADARQSALARGFTGVCLATLVDTESQLQVERQFALTAQRLAKESSTLTNRDGLKSAPSPSGIALYQSDLKAFDKAFLALTKLNGPTKLSVCPHR